MRRILYVTGTRADFGLMRSSLLMIHSRPSLELGVLATGMHLDSQYGDTIREVESCGIPIVARVPVQLRSDSGSAMAKAIGMEILGMVEAFERWAPEVVMLLGDRGEMLAGAIAALHLNIPIVHIHGGERSGTVDEPVRHAISKLAHYHFTATASARERLIRMGEREENIFVTGAPGLDGLLDISRPVRDEMALSYGFDPSRAIALVIFHPVVQHAEFADRQMRTLLDGIRMVEGLQALVLMPNADAGGEAIRAVLSDPALGVRVVDHFQRDEFCRWMSVVDVMVGNSSSGIIEAASFHTPVVNVGDRQFGRERSDNVVDVEVEVTAIQCALVQALARGRIAVRNVYGEGVAGLRITDLLERLPLNRDLLLKYNAY